MINGSDVKKLRAALGISQKELAEKLGVSTRTIANYEAGGVIPANKQLMIDTMLKSARNATNTGSIYQSVIGDGNFSNAGNIKGNISINDVQEIKQLQAKIKELEKDLFHIRQRLQDKDEMISILKLRLNEQQKNSQD